MHDLAVYVKEGVLFAQDVSLENLADSFSTVDHPLHLCAWFLIVFHLTQIRFTQSTHLQICLSLETLTAIIRTGLPILVELIDLMNSVTIALSEMTLTG